MIQTANEMFDELPSQARTKFKNNPALFLDFVQNEDNKDKLYELGLSDFPNSIPDKPNETRPVILKTEEKQPDAT